MYLLKKALTSKQLNLLVSSVIVSLSVIWTNLSYSSQTVITTNTQAPNLPTVIKQLNSYADNGEYQAEIAVTMQHAKQALIKILQQKHRKPLAIIFDIDETTLSNLPELQDNQFHYDPKIFEAWVLQAKAPAIKPVLTFYQFAQSQGVNIFFITGRQASWRAATEKNLAAVGYDHYQKIYFEANTGVADTANYKTTDRQKIIDQGYDVVMSIGDQYSDLCDKLVSNNSHVSKHPKIVLVKLPNPFYYISGCTQKQLQAF